MAMTKLDATIILSDVGATGMHGIGSVRFALICVFGRSRIHLWRFVAYRLPRAFSASFQHLQPRNERKPKTQQVPYCREAPSWHNVRLDNWWTSNASGARAFCLSVLRADFRQLHCSSKLNRRPSMRSRYIFIYLGPVYNECDFIRPLCFPASSIVGC